MLTSISSLIICLNSRKMINDTDLVKGSGIFVFCQGIRNLKVPLIPKISNAALKAKEFLRACACNLS